MQRPGVTAIKGGQGGRFYLLLQSIKAYPIGKGIWQSKNVAHQWSAKLGLW
jgi:hypothetical protein